MTESELRSLTNGLVLEVLNYFPGLWWDLSHITVTVQVRTSHFVQPYLYPELRKLIAAGKVLERQQTDDEFEDSKKSAKGLPVARDYMYRIVG